MHPSVVAKVITKLQSKLSMCFGIAVVHMNHTLMLVYSIVQNVTKNSVTKCSLPLRYIYVIVRMDGKYIKTITVVLLIKLHI